MTQLLIIAHAPLASAFEALARHTYGELLAREPWALGVCDVGPDDDAEVALEAASRRLDALWGAAGCAPVPGAENAAPPPTLVLTDVFGATPANVARRLADARSLRLLVGLNLPMLWRALNYRQRPPEELAALAVAGATQGVMQLAATRPQNQVLRAPTHDSIVGHHQQ